MKKPVKSDSGRCTIANYPALVALGFRENGRMRGKIDGDICVLGCHGAKGFWVMNRARGTKSMFSPADLARQFNPLKCEATA